MSVKYCRDTLRKQILTFTKGKDLKKPFIIEKKVQYNGKEYDNIPKLKCDDDSGMWKMGYKFIWNDEIQNYIFTHYSVVWGVVEVNAEIYLNKKLTVQHGYINYFTKMHRMSQKETCDDYLEPLLRENNNIISAEEGFTFRYL